MKWFIKDTEYICMHIEFMVMHDVQNESLVFLYQLGTLSPLPSGEKEVSQTSHYSLHLTLPLWLINSCSVVVSFYIKTVIIFKLAGYNTVDFYYFCLIGQYVLRFVSCQPLVGYTIVKFTQLCSKFPPTALLNFACDWLALDRDISFGWLTSPVWRYIPIES